MRSAPFVAAIGLLWCACKGSPHRPDAADKPILDAYDPPWFHPTPGEITNWDIQLQAPYDFTQQRQMMVVDLWEVVPSATTLDYGDGAPVTVPAGPQPTRVAELKAAGTTVICEVGTGSIRLDDPDAMKFPGYEATPPDRPDAVAAGSVIGWSTSMADAAERFLDVRAASRPQFEKYIMKRLELAKMTGCDGVLAKGNDAILFESTIGHGFAALAPAEQASWVVALAAKSHAQETAIGGRGGQTLPLLETLTDDYDFLVAERCTEIPDCDRGRPFINYERAVFGLDYDIKENGTATTKAIVCGEWMKASVDGIVKKAVLDGTFRDTCP